jgi:AraC-like DNA-binding protein
MALNSLYGQNYFDRTGFNLSKIVPFDNVCGFNLHGCAVTGEQTQSGASNTHYLVYPVHGSERAIRITKTGDIRWKPESFSIRSRGDSLRIVAPDPRTHFHYYFTQQHLEQTSYRVAGNKIPSIELRSVHYETNKCISSIILNLALTSNWDDEADRLALSHAGMLLTYQIIKSYCDIDQFLMRGPRKLPDKMLRQLIDYMDANMSEGLTVSELADVAGLSTFHFARSFRETVGDTPHRYLMARRVEKASQLLQHSNDNIVDIALNCGFSSQAHFTSRFKQATGFTPRQYRLCLSS